jgi:hypothetical protein
VGLEEPGLRDVPDVELVADAKILECGPVVLDLVDDRDPRGVVREDPAEDNRGGPRSQHERSPDEGLQSVGRPWDPTEDEENSSEDETRQERERLARGDHLQTPGDAPSVAVDVRFLHRADPLRRHEATISEARQDATVVDEKIPRATVEYFHDAAFREVRHGIDAVGARDVDPCLGEPEIERLAFVGQRVCRLLLAGVEVGEQELGNAVEDVSVGHDVRRDELVLGERGSEVIRNSGGQRKFWCEDFEAVGIEVRCVSTSEHAAVVPVRICEIAAELDALPQNFSDVWIPLVGVDLREEGDGGGLVAGVRPVVLDRPAFPAVVKVPEPAPQSLEGTSKLRLREHAVRLPDGEGRHRVVIRKLVLLRLALADESGSARYRSLDPVRRGRIDPSPEQAVGLGSRVGGECSRPDPATLEGVELVEGPLSMLDRCPKVEGGDRGLADLLIAPVRVVGKLV